MKNNKITQFQLGLISLIILVIVLLLESSLPVTSDFIGAKVNSGLSLLVIGGLAYGAWVMYRGSRKQWVASAFNYIRGDIFRHDLFKISAYFSQFPCRNIQCYRRNIRYRNVKINMTFTLRHGQTTLPSELWRVITVVLHTSSFFSNVHRAAWFGHRISARSFATTDGRLSYKLFCSKGSFCMS